jgi:hypothetical protein
MAELGHEPTVVGSGARKPDALKQLRSIDGRVTPP